jgi:hypothetical protein
MWTAPADQAFELDPPVFRQLSAKPVARYHENFTVSRAWLRPGALYLRGRMQQNYAPGVINSA